MWYGVYKIPNMFIKVLQRSKNVLIGLQMFENVD